MRYHLSLISILVCSLFTVQAVTAASKPHEVYYKQAIEQDKSGNYAEAIKLYSKILALKPKTPEIYYLRGRALRQSNQLDAALSDFNKALEIRPTYPEALNYRGIIYIGKQRPNDALADFTKACASGYQQACTNRNKLNPPKK